ncbi:MAG TPA: glycerol-3-phosphate acyltransferase [Chloroflexi bacterium]|nr:glycerol-3-phosphate acyltransferase [Chloroflexota bacterium]
MQIVMTILVAIGAYLIGSIPVGLLVVRLKTGKDVRKVGSGRTGGTNVFRAAGPAIAVLSMLGDFAKGWIAVWLAQALVGTPIAEALAGVLAITGHNYSIFIRFDGGVGAITTVGSATALWPVSLPFLAAMGIPMIYITRHTSVGSMTVGLLLPMLFILGAWLGDLPSVYLIHGVGALFLIFWALRPNIERLRSGEERRVVLDQHE